MGLTRPLAGGRAIVTGGAGFIGSWLCERLLDLGAEVLCIDNCLTGTWANVAHLKPQHRLNVLHHDVCEHFAIDGHVDWVLHLASVASPTHYVAHPIETMKVGSLGTLNALELAEIKAARFVLTSTSEVYGDPQEHPQRESYWGHVNPVGPRSVYDESKRFGEALTAAFRTARGVNTGIARIFNTYGPRMRTDDGRAVPTFVTQALQGVPLTVAGDGSQTRSLCYVADTVEAIIALATSNEAGPLNVGNPDEVTILELAAAILALVGGGSSIRRVPVPEDDPRRRKPDISLVAARLGWRPTTPLDEGLRTTLDWFAQQSGLVTRPVRPEAGMTSR